MASHQCCVAPLLDQIVHQQGLHDEQGWLRVAGVVEVVGTAAATAVGRAAAIVVGAAAAIVVGAAADAVAAGMAGLVPNTATLVTVGP